MKQMTASVFKVTWLQVMDDVAAIGGPIMITTHDHPVCQLVPCRPRPKTFYSALKGSVVITGDLIPPLNVPWEAL